MFVSSETRALNALEIAARLLNRPTYEQNLLLMAFEIRNVGLRQLPAELVKKEVHKHTREDRETIATARYAGIQMLETMHNGQLECIAKIVSCIDEAWDGSGLPRGISGEMIPLAARIIKVAEWYEWLLSDEKLDINFIVHILEDGAGSLFDPQVVAAFVRAIAIQEEA
jgi:response regulator RpfG family c-di-GMP phosphodiesterase